MKKVFLFVTGFIFSCCAAAKSVSNPSDYFRSASTGDWGTLTTWESSPDNTTWLAATLIPDNGANTIYIRNTHSVTVSTNQNMDQVIIESGGILFHSANTLTVSDGVGDDINILAGGIFTLASAANPVVFAVSTATVNISTTAILRVAATGLTFASPNPGVNTSNYIYQNASVLEYTPNLAFASAGVTFFPNVNAATIPIFRTTGNLGLIGGASFTIFNGLFEANGTITFANSGTKTFRNGIIGTGNISSDVSSGKFIINGTTASLGGTGSLTLPSVNGMDIGNTTTVTMVSDKAITGNIALLSDALVMLGTFNLTMTGIINGGSATSHIVTNSTGKLFINNIVAAPVIFPIGANTTTINPLAIFNGSNLNYGARVEVGLNPNIRFPIAAVNRTWVVNPSGLPAGPVNVNFFYNNTHGNALFNYSSTVEHGFNTGVWNVINTGLTQFGGPPNYQVTTTVNIFAANSDAPMVIGNIGAILAIDKNIQLTAQKLNDKILLKWIVNNAVDILNFIPERSADGRNYSALAEFLFADFNFTDAQPVPGLNYYRIKIKDKNGRQTISNTVVILHAASGFELINISPNPVTNGVCKINISAATNMQLEIMITDLQGRIVKKQKVNAMAGFNTIPINVSKLGAGAYQLVGYAANERTKIIRFIIQ